MESLYLFRLQHVLPENPFHSAMLQNQTFSVPDSRPMHTMLPVLQENKQKYESFLPSLHKVSRIRLDQYHLTVCMPLSLLNNMVPRLPSHAIFSWNLPKYAGFPRS